MKQRKNTRRGAHSKEVKGMPAAENLSLETNQLSFGAQSVNNCCRDKMFPTIHFLVAWKRKNIFVACKGGRIRITFIVFSFPWVTFYFLVCGTALNSSSF